MMLVGGGGCLFTYSCSARQVSFEFELTNKRNPLGITRIDQ